MDMKFLIKVFPTLQTNLFTATTFTVFGRLELELE